MGDTTVDFFLETLKNIITISDLDFFKHSFQSLAEEIEYLRGFLKITEKKRNEHLEVMNLVIRIRDVVFEAGNIVELLVVLVRSNSLWGVNLYELERVITEIKTLRAEVKQILDENMYDINKVVVQKLKHSSTQSGGGSSSSGGRNTSKRVEEKVVVGFKEEVETLMGKLHDNGEGGRLEIISIVGAGGGGKTTLAREVYDHPWTLHAFEIRAWVNVSQDYDKTMKRDLLKQILKSLSRGEHEDSEDKLGENILKCLKGKKYFIVMDDIWDIEAWNDIQRSFPRESKGSKLLFTSRQLLVQPESDHYVHHLAPLQESSSWELLQKKVFGMKCCPQELVDIGKRIAKKCEGLPLAIVAISGILAMEDKTLDVWEEVAEHLSSIIAKKQEGCMEILELSYNHLPLHLKACFLYIGAHPEDCEISVRELIWLWIAEGFIQKSKGGESLEAIAEDYLISLIDRSLVMVARRSNSHGGIKACRIHDLLRELCLKKAEEDSFFVKIHEDDPFQPSATNKHRRLFIGHQFWHYFSSRHPFFDESYSRDHARNLHSILYFCMSSSLKKNLSFFVENFKLLRVLHLIYAATSLGEIKVGDLFSLKYLALTLPEVNHFPAMNSYRAPHPCFFHYLPILETLNLQVSDGDRISLPRHIVKMVNLRHLFTNSGIFEYHHASYDEEEGQLGNIVKYHHDEDEGNMLDSLQTLHRMCICEHCLRFLKRTPNLRKLGLRGDYDLGLPNLEFLECLEILNVQMVRVARTWLKLPPTLTRLTLSHTYLKWKKLSIILLTLPKLEVLKLFSAACKGPVWNTSKLEEGFSQLKYLRLEQLDIEEWNASEDQFPKLKVLVIEWCRNLKGIPINFANLYDLREIKVEWSSRSAEESAREIQEEQRSINGDDCCLNLLTGDNGG